MTRPKNEFSQTDFDRKAYALSVYERGLKQCEISLALIGYIKDDILNKSLMHRSIRRLFAYATHYMDKPLLCGYDYCEMCNKRLLKSQRINPKVKAICLNIVECIRIGVSAEDIFATLSSNRSLYTLIKEHQEKEDNIAKETNLSHSHHSIASSSSNSQQSTEKDLKTWEVVLRCSGAIVVFVFLIWIIVEFVVPAVFFIVIFIVFFFDSLKKKFIKQEFLQTSPLERTGEI